MMRDIVRKQLLLDVHLPVTSYKPIRIRQLVRDNRTIYTGENKTRLIFSRINGPNVPFHLFSICECVNAIYIVAVLCTST